MNKKTLFALLLTATIASHISVYTCEIQIINDNPFYPKPTSQDKINEKILKITLKKYYTSSIITFNSKNKSDAKKILNFIVTNCFFNLYVKNENIKTRNKRILFSDNTENIENLYYYYTQNQSNYRFVKRISLLKNRSDETCIDYAHKNQYEENITFFTKILNSIETYKTRHLSPLMVSVTKKDTAILDFLLLSNIVDVNLKNPTCNSALFYAAMDNNSPALIRLLQCKNININIKNIINVTPLHTACRNDNNEIVQILLRNPNIDTDIKMNFNQPTIYKNENGDNAYSTYCYEYTPFDLLLVFFNCKSFEEFLKYYLEQSKENINKVITDICTKTFIGYKICEQHGEKGKNVKEKIVKIVKHMLKCISIDEIKVIVKKSKNLDSYEIIMWIQNLHNNPNELLTTYLKNLRLKKNN